MVVLFIVAAAAAVGMIVYTVFLSDHGGGVEVDSPSGQVSGDGLDTQSPDGQPSDGMPTDGLPTATPGDGPGGTPSGTPSGLPSWMTNGGNGDDDPQETFTSLPLAGAVIGIDPGHQAEPNYDQEEVSPDSDTKKAKVSSGATGVSSQVREYVVNLEVALILKQYLEELGAEVVITRESHDVDISNKERAMLMNESNVDLCIRIHCNGDNDKSRQGGLMLLPELDIFEGVKERSYEAGIIIHRVFLETTGAVDDGIRYRSDLTGFNWSEVPVCLIEMGYMSNEQEDLLLVDPEYQELCARGLADGIVEWWLGLV
jgi:N-acetylmuramoyl-L-alanine amidase